MADSVKTPTARNDSLNGDRTTILPTRSSQGTSKIQKLIFIENQT